ncbi:uncharacterized protein PG986_003462 [Apiospora aurea]|uniref:Uncharacterized protein n=1 Tax=Apiospora aurea TaxID=335848 RepID=A0ABR1QSP4_9PEZI
MVKRSIPTREPSSPPFDFALDVLGQRKLPRRIFRVPADQERLLREPTSWAEDLFRRPQGLANVTVEVLDNLSDFHSRRLQEPQQQSSAIASQSSSVIHKETAVVPTSPSGTRSNLGHGEDGDSSPGTLISGWNSSPPPVPRSEPPEEESDDDSFASQLPAPSVAMIQPISSPEGPDSRRDQSSLEQPFETQLPARPPLQVGPGISNLQKRPVFDDFPSSSPAMDEELEIVQPAAYDRDMMPPPPHKAVEPNPTPPSAQQVQVPSTFPEPQSSKSASEPPKVKAARKHRLMPRVDVVGLLTDDLPPTKPLITSGLRAPPPKARPHKYVPESSFSDETSSSIVPSTENHMALHTPFRDTNGKSPSKTLIRETQVSLSSKQLHMLQQSPKPKPPTPRSPPRIAHSPLSSSHGNPSSPSNRPLTFSPPPPVAAPLPAPPVQLSVPNSAVPVPDPSGDDSGPRPDEPVVQPVEQNGMRDQGDTNLEEKLADLEEQLKQAKLNIAYYEAQARSGHSSSSVHTAGCSKPAEIHNHLSAAEEDAMVVDEVPQQREMVERDAEHTPFDQYTNAYPAYKNHGNIWEFVKACVYIQQLQRKKALATYQYDDFIRAWTEGFVPYVLGFNLESPEKPLTAIEWYMETVDNAHFQFREGVITRDNLETVFEKHPEETEGARSHLRVAGSRRSPLPKMLPLAEPTLALPPTPAIGTAQLLDQVHAQPEEEVGDLANGADSAVPAGHSQGQQELRGSQSDPLDGTITEARKPKSPAGSLRHSTSEIFSRKRPAGDEVIAVSPRRKLSRTLSSRQSERSTPSATLQPSSTCGGLPRSSAPWLGPRKHANDPKKRARSWEKFLAKKMRRDQESIVNSSAPPGGTPSSGQKE